MAFASALATGKVGEVDAEVGFGEEQTIGKGDLDKAQSANEIERVPDHARPA